MESQVIENPTVRVLFLASDPSDTTKIRLGKELQEIRDKLKSNPNFELQDKLAVKPNDVLQTIINYKPHIVHFAGHGLESGEVCFEDEQGNARPMPPEALSALFSLVTDHIKCVIVNTCFSEQQAIAIAQYIPVVIGTRKEIGDKAAIGFSTGFYTALEANLSQQSIKKAYEIGCVAIRFSGSLTEYSTPVLIFGAPEVRFSSEVDTTISNVINSQGIDAKILRQALLVKGKRMGISIEKAEAIINNKFEDIREYKNRITLYQTAFQDALYEEYPLSDETKKALSYLRNELGVRIEDAVTVEKNTLADSKWLSSEYYYDRGKKQSSLENYETSIGYFTEAIKIKQEYSGAYFERGLSYFKLLKHDLALENMNTALQINKNWAGRSLASAYFNKGYVHYYYDPKTLGGKDEQMLLALNDWSKSIELNPNDALTYYNKALCNHYFGDFQEALKNFKKSLELRTPHDNKSSSVYYWIGQCYDALGNTELADEAYQKRNNLLEGKTESDSAVAEKDLDQ